MSSNICAGSFGLSSHSVNLNMVSQIMHTTVACIFRYAILYADLEAQYTCGVGLMCKLDLVSNEQTTCHIAHVPDRIPVSGLTTRCPGDICRKIGHAYVIGYRNGSDISASWDTAEQYAPFTRHDDWCSWNVWCVRIKLGAYGDTSS